VGAAGLEVLMTQEYLPSFKLMIGGSDYHLFSRENTLGDQMLGNKVVHQYIRKASQVIRGSIKRSVPTQQSSASPDIIHIAQEDVNLADMMIDVADVKNGLPTYLKQTESVKKKKVNKVDTVVQ
jgi:fructose-specific phosphotransferase system component IIB